MAGVGLASAQSSTTGGQSLVDKIAQKFNLNKTDVQKVFDDNKAANQADREQKMADKLAQAVKDGKITQAQSDLITAKQKELQTQRQAAKDSIKNMSQVERKAAMDKQRADLKQWLADNKIPDGYLMGGRDGGPGGPPPDGSMGQ